MATVGMGGVVDEGREGGVRGSSRAFGSLIRTRGRLQDQEFLRGRWGLDVLEKDAIEWILLFLFIYLFHFPRDCSANAFEPIRKALRQGRLRS